MPALVDRVGKRYGSLVVIERADGGHTTWKCYCDCGRTRNVRAEALDVASDLCFCSGKLIDLTGRRFGSLVVLERAGTDYVGTHRQAKPTWRCRCDCVQIVIVRGYRLTRGLTKRCKACGHERLTTGGPQHSSWKGCGQLSGAYWRIVCAGATTRSIVVDLTIEQAWRLYEQQRGRCALTGTELSLSRTGKGQTQTASLDRIDSKRGYELDNVQWVHKRIQLMKNYLDQDEFVAWCALVAEHKARARAA